MIQLLQSLDDILNQTRMEFLNAIRPCIVIKDIPELILGGLKIGPYLHSTRIELPNWVIESLRRQGFVEVVPEADYTTLQYVQDVHRIEEENQHKGLQPIHPLLYSAINLKMELMRKDAGALDPKQFDDFEKLRLLLSMISQKRFSKIIRVAISGAFQEKRKDMTLEERWLCETISRLMTDWKNRFL